MGTDKALIEVDGRRLVDRPAAVSPGWSGRSGSPSPARMPSPTSTRRVICGACKRSHDGGDVLAASIPIRLVVGRLAGARAGPPDDHADPGARLARREGHRAPR